MLLRHSVLWVLRDTTTHDLQIEMRKGLAYLAMECRDVRAGDYGEDLFEGSRPLREVQPWLRTPRWRSLEAPPSNFDVALHLDFDDFAAHDSYGADPVHNAASDFNGTVSTDELTARVDWWHEGPLTHRGHVKHVAMFVWADDATEAAKQQAQDAVRRLEVVPGVERVTTGQNVGHLTTDFDWILDVQVPDKATAGRLLDSEQYSHAMRSVAAATKYEWTARLTHMMRGY